MGCSIKVGQAGAKNCPSIAFTLSLGAPHDGLRAGGLGGETGAWRESWQAMSKSTMSLGRPWSSVRALGAARGCLDGALMESNEEAASPLEGSSRVILSKNRDSFPPPFGPTQQRRQQHQQQQQQQQNNNNKSKSKNCRHQKCS